MAELTEEQLIAAEQKRREKFATFSKGVDTGKIKEPTPNPEADKGAPKSGWRKVIENVTKDILGK